MRALWRHNVPVPSHDQQEGLRSGDTTGTSPTWLEQTTSAARELFGARMIDQVVRLIGRRIPA
jgi:hypothetical protein